MSLTFQQGDWVTIPAAAFIYDLPEDVIERAIIDGYLEVQRACGARVVRKSEICPASLIIRYGKEASQ